ncbi:MAG: hypothetical protein SXV54_13145 [Chloroflexota bacterium]|nr:hypothetical protein [Chloroflexota bacterium]
MQDDVLDLVGDQAKMGKPVDSGLHQGPITLPEICHIETHPDGQDLQMLLSRQMETTPLYHG